MLHYNFHVFTDSDTECMFTIQNSALWLLICATFTHAVVVKDDVFISAQYCIKPVV